MTTFEDLRTGLDLDRETRWVRRGHRLAKLTRTESALLQLFLEHPGQVLLRAQIIEQVWGARTPSHNALEAHVSGLRRKLGDREHTLVRTVYGIGYQLRTSPPGSSLSDRPAAG